MLRELRYGVALNAASPDVNLRKLRVCAVKDINHGLVCQQGQVREYRARCEVVHDEVALLAIGFTREAMLHVDVQAEFGADEPCEVFHDCDPHVSAGASGRDLHRPAQQRSHGRSAALQRHQVIDTQLGDRVCQGFRQDVVDLDGNTAIRTTPVNLDHTRQLRNDPSDDLSQGTERW
jgi:hypothetical protein